MTAAKHTPGPWFTPEKLYQTRYIEARIGGGMLQEVAACGPTEVPSQQEANARLIAAAPELLSLLVDAVTSFADSVEGGEADEWVIACRTAIAKATGSAS